MYTTRRILLPELRRLHMAHPDFAVIDWFADRYAAVEEAARLNEEDRS